jgi:hypothetical protein
VKAASAVVRVGAVVLAIGIAACAEARDPFDRRITFERIERSFRDEGLQLCSNVEKDGNANQAVASHEYRLAIDCSTSDDAAVTVDKFTQAEDRDAAARGFEVQSRPRAGGAVYTLGPFAVLVLPATTDDNILKKTNAALKKLSAD